MEARWQTWYSHWRACARLLYWSYFKPYTLADELKRIHPELTLGRSAWQLRQAVAANAELAEYFRKVSHLHFVVPLVMSLLVACFYSMSGQEYSWERSTSLPLSYGISAWLTLRWIRVQTYRLWGLLIALVLPLLWSSGLFYIFALVALGAAGGAAADVALGMAGGVALGVAGGVAGRPSFSVAGGAALGVAGGAALGVAFSVAFSMTFSVAFSVAVGLLFGVASGLTFVCGALRLYFWPIEALWMTIIRLAVAKEHAGRSLSKLPIYFDEFIVLPLPFLGRFLASAYASNQAATRQTLAYLTTHSNQQQAVQHAQRLIILQELERCDSTQAIAAVHRELSGLAQPPPPALDPILPALFDISQDVAAALQATTFYRQQQLLTERIKTLQSLREQLANTSQAAHQTGSIIDRWLRLLQQTVAILKAQADREGEILPVYVAGPHLRPSE